MFDPHIEKRGETKLETRGIGRRQRERGIKKRGAGFWRKS